MTPRTVYPALFGFCALVVALPVATVLYAQGPSWPADYVTHMAHAHMDETPVANASDTIAPSVDVVGEEVTYGTGDDGAPLHGYLAYPSSAIHHHAHPGVLVIHEWWGLNDNVRAMTRRIAGEGYTALAVDLYGGKSATVPDSAKALMMGVMAKQHAALTNLKAANAYLRYNRSASPVGTLGWCFGGGWSIREALFDAKHVAAAVAYYGPPDLNASEAAKLRAPFLGLYGGADESIPVAQVNQFKHMLDTLGKTVTVKIYDGAKHAFANPSSPSYDSSAADDAWQQAIAFLAHNLKE